MSPPDRMAGALAALPALPRDAGGPVFPTPWAARVFALAAAANERGVFSWSEWSQALGAALARSGAAHGNEPEAYWQAWLAALEGILEEKQVAGLAELTALQEAWRHAAEATPHGQPIELVR